MESPVDLVMAAADGDISAALEAALLLAAGSAAAAAAWSLVSDEPAAEEAPPTVVDEEAERFGVDVDLGKEGEPPGVSRLLFQPLLARSDLLQLQLRVPLGLVIEERRGDGGGATTIAVTGCLPGYSAISQVEVGDLVRGATAG